MHFLGTDPGVGNGRDTNRLSVAKCLGRIEQLASYMYVADFKLNLF